MADKISIDGVEHEISDLDEISKKLVISISKVDEKIHDNANLIAVLTRAKNSYMEELKRKALADKAGFDFLE